MHFNPPTGKNSSNPFYHPLNEMKFIEEAVTVEMEFKTDADGAAVVGSETKRRGMLISGQKIRNKVYRLTFKNNNAMNQFMKTYDNKLNEGTEELEESTPAYRKMMKRYKGSDMEKVFKILDKEGFRMGEQSDTLVRNMLKKHKGNVKKAADQIMKDNPGMFDVNRMMMDHVQIDEAKATARNIVKGLSDSDGPFTVVAMKRDKVIKQESTKMRNMLPAIISEMRKEVGSGVTIAIEDRRGTIRNTFKESVKRVIDNLNDYVNLNEEQNPEPEQGSYEAIILQMKAVLAMYTDPNFDPKVYFGTNETGQQYVLYFDYDGNGLVDFEDLQILLSLQSQGLPPMYADAYRKYMASDARSGIKQQQGAQIQFGTTRGSGTSRPPVAPPPTGGMGGR